MRLCFIVDARSPISINWINYFVPKHHEVYVISTYQHNPNVLPGVVSFEIPFALARFAGSNLAIQSANRGYFGDFRSTIAALRTGRLSRSTMKILRWINSIDVYRHRTALHHIVSSIDPQVVHAMRIPFEGILASEALSERYRLVVSIWGNDITLHAAENRLIAVQTRRVLQRADALHCDCNRDLRLAGKWGFNLKKPNLVVPGIGGIHLDIFYPQNDVAGIRRRLSIPLDVPVVLNPRGIRGYVRNDLFFRAVKLVVREFPKTVFVCTGMADNVGIIKTIKELNIHNNVMLLPTLPRHEMADLYRIAQVMVSPSMHDGTPNTLLEAMASGCLPVVAEIESVAEWITHNKNGLMFDCLDVEMQSKMIMSGLEDKQLQIEAKYINRQLIEERADYIKVMARVEEFYEQLLN